jgi:hypothetical protein
VIDGVEQVGCGGFGFLDQGFRDAFNAELKNLQADGTVERIVTSFGFAVEDVEKAASLTAEELANPGSGDAAAPEGLLADLQDAGDGADRYRQRGAVRVRGRGRERDW